MAFVLEGGAGQSRRRQARLLLSGAEKGRVVQATSGFFLISSCAGRVSTPTQWNYAHRSALRLTNATIAGEVPPESSLRRRSNPSPGLPTAFLADIPNRPRPDVRPLSHPQSATRSPTAKNPVPPGQPAQTEPHCAHSHNPQLPAELPTRKLIDPLPFSIGVPKRYTTTLLFRSQIDLLSEMKG